MEIRQEKYEKKAETQNKTVQKWGFHGKTKSLIIGIDDPRSMAKTIEKNLSN